MDTIARLARLLDTPDPPELRGRGSSVTYPGDPHRRHRVLKPLLLRWMVRRHLTVDPQESSAQPAVKTSALRFWRRA